MAKKRKSKKNQTTLLVLFVAILLSVLTICTLFMPMLKTASDSLGGASLTGAEIIEVAFADDGDGMTLQQMSMLYTKKSDDGFSTGVYCWAYFISLIAAAAVLVFAVLKIVGIKLDLVGVIAGAALVVLSLVVFIFGFIACGKFTVEWIATIGAYFAFFGGLLGGAAAVYGAKK